jgi:cell division protein FtsW (lipid II flippase)
LSDQTATPVATGTPPAGIKRIRMPAKLRNLEFWLLLVACFINAAAIVLVQLGALCYVDTQLVLLGAGLSALVFGLHIAMRFVARDADPFLLPIATVLNGLGIAMIYRIDIADQQSGWESAAVRQIAWSAIAIICAIATILVIRNHRVLFRYTYVAGFVAIVLLLLPLLPGIGREVSGARVWIGFGDIATFQPGEIAKIALIVFFAGYLVSVRDVLSLAGRKVLGFTFPRGRDLGPILIAWLVSLAVLIFEKDLGSSLLFFGVFVAMLYVATERVSWIAIGLALFAAGAYLAYRIFDHVQQRVELWLDPFSQASIEQSDQLAKGIMGMASGGLFGTGLGQGRPWLVAFSNSDFIFASFGEELGLFGVAALLALYAVFVERGLRTALGVRDGFGKLLAFGLAFSVGLQVFVVIGGVTKVIPLTGLTTPFMSLGGSSLLANWALMAILLRISDQARRPVSDDPIPEQEKPAENATEVVAMP